MSVDIEGLPELIADLGRSAARSLPLVDAVLKNGADNIKREMAADAAGSTYFGGISRTITYDADYRLNQPAYEIGPDRSRGGSAALAHIAYLGGANGGGGTLDLDKPLRSEEPRLMKALDDALRDVL